MKNLIKRVKSAKLLNLKLLSQLTVLEYLNGAQKPYYGKDYWVFYLFGF